MTSKLYLSIVPRIFFKSFTVVFGTYHANFLFGMHEIY